MFKQNFGALLFSLGCVAMGIHADLLRNTFDGCPVSVFVGRSGRGKTYSLKLLLAILGEYIDFVKFESSEEHCIKSIRQKVWGLWQIWVELIVLNADNLCRTTAIHRDALFATPTLENTLFCFNLIFKWYYNENRIFPFKSILKHNWVACMRQKMLFTTNVSIRWRNIQVL